MKENSTQEKKIYHWQKVAVLLVIFDVIAIVVSFAAALWLRFDLHYSQIPENYFQTFLRFIPFYTILTIFVYSFLH